MLPSCQRINHQPEMILGLNGSELLVVLSLSLVLGMSLGAVMTVLMEVTSLLMLVGFSLSVAFGAIASKVMKAIKRQRPQGYYQQWVMVKVGGLFGFGMPVIQGGVYDYRRHDGCEL